MSRYNIRDDPLFLPRVERRPEAVGAEDGGATGGVAWPNVPEVTVAGLASVEGNIAIATNASTGPALVFYNGSNWISVLTGTTVTT